MLIKTYRKIISPILGCRCRFHPTCSQYGIEVIQKFGIFKGCWLTLSRLLQCHPLNINTNKTKLQILKKKTTENIQNGLPT